jgi:hypothetical protein
VDGSGTEEETSNTEFTVPVKEYPAAILGFFKLMNVQRFHKIEPSIDSFEKEATHARQTIAAASPGSPLGEVVAGDNDPSR